MNDDKTNTNRLMNFRILDCTSDWMYKDFVKRNDIGEGYYE